MRQHRDVEDRSQPARTPDAESTRRNILEVANEEFASKGYSGSRIDEIGARTNTSKRMIYYYFGDKEGLYLAVLEEAYRRIRTIEDTLDLDHLGPEEALAKLAGFTFDYQNENRDFIRLVMVENIHNGEHLKKSRAIRDVNATAINKVKRLYQRGVATGVFRKDLDPVDIHMTISALCFFNVSNRATFSEIFDRDMGSATELAKRRAIVIDTVLRYVRA